MPDRSRTNTPEVEEAVAEAFNASCDPWCGPNGFITYFEHGRWWLRTLDPHPATRRFVTYEVVDEPDDCAGFTFKEVPT